jgi:hypothetical protein
MFLAVGVGRLRGRHLPHDHPRLLQGAAVPRLRLGHPRHARGAGHAPHGRPAQVHARSPRPPSSSAGWPSPACPRSPASGPRTRSSSTPGPTAPALWAVGLVTALLTAFYMSRQVFMVFFGEERWHDRGPTTTASRPRSTAEPRSAQLDDRRTEAEALAEPAPTATPTARRPRDAGDPHESPWTMTLPLVVLAGLAGRRAGSTCRSPRTCTSSSTGSSRSLGDNEAHIDVATGTKVGLAVSPTSPGSSASPPPPPSTCAASRRADRAAVPRRGLVLRQLHRRLHGRPRPRRLRGRVLVRPHGHRRRRQRRRRRVRARVATGLRVLQTGFVRSYALGAAVGAVAAPRLLPHEGGASDGLPPCPPPRRHAVPPAHGARPGARRRRAAGGSSPRPAELHRPWRCCSRPPPGRSPSGAAAFETGDAGFQFEVEPSPWIDDLGISWHLGVDGISLFLVVLTGLLFPLAIVAVTPKHDPKPYYAWLLLLQAGCIGVFSALDLFLFFVMFEIVLVPMYFLIGGWGYGRARSTRPQVLPLHDVRLGAHARRHRGLAFLDRDGCSVASSAARRGRSSRRCRRADLQRRSSRSRPTPSTSSTAEGRRDHRRSPSRPASHRSVVEPLRLGGGQVDLPRLRHGLRGEGAAVPAAHLAARRPHRGAHRRVGDPRRRHAEARHLRLRALRPLPVPRGLGVLRPGAW